MAMMLVALPRTPLRQDLGLPSQRQFCSGPVLYVPQPICTAFSGSARFLTIWLRGQSNDVGAILTLVGFSRKRFKVRVMNEGRRFQRIFLALPGEGNARQGGRSEG
jgi:hypothetical protein